MVINQTYFRKKLPNKAFNFLDQNCFLKVTPSC